MSNVPTAESRETAIDKELFAFLEKVEPKVLKRVGVTISEEEEKKFFESNFTINPKVNYHELETTHGELEDLQNNLREKGRFLVQSFIDSRSLSAEEKDYLLSYYHTLLSRWDALYDLLIASKNQNFQGFTNLSKKIYGEPSVEIFNTYVKRLGNELNRDHTSDEIAQSAEEVRTILPTYSGTTLEMNQIQLDGIRGKLHPLMSPILTLLEQYNSDDELNTGQIVEVFELALSTISANEWQVELSDKYKTTTVDQTKKKLYVPNKAISSKTRVLGSVAHEVYTHILRGLNAQKLLPYEILRMGMPGYTEGEEALATFSEAAFNPKKDLELDGGDQHFAVCLALGLDGIPRDFKDVFQILYRIKVFTKLSQGIDQDKAFKDARTSAWKTTIRVFRGTSFSQHGLCFTKDIAPGEGRLGLTKYLVESGNIEQLWQAKYPPWLQAHLGVINRYKK